MSFVSKFGIVGLIAALASGAAAPPASAQTRDVQRIVQVNAGGSYLGIQMEDVTAANMSRYKLAAERGVIVREVVKGSPAEAATLKEDDVVLDFGGQQVWSTAQFSRLVQETPVGRKVELGVSRDGNRLNLTAQIGDRRGMRADSGSEMLPRDFPEFGERMFQFRVPDSEGERPGETSSRRARLGVTLQPLTDQMGEFLGVPGKKGVLVASVLSGSASAGKLKSGDVIISADGKSIESPDDLTRIIRNKAEGDVTLRVIRDKKEITVTVTLPAEEGEGRGYKL